jgi:multidrug efflux pump subunit AcrB
MEANPGMTPAEAASAAMGEITGAIVAITLVLLSVFVPVAFIPGISGQLFQQFAVAVSVSMVISAINALTLSPALCAIMLKPHHGPQDGRDGLDLAPDRPHPRRLRPHRRGHRAAGVPRRRAADRRAGAHGRFFRARAHRVPARRGSGRLLRGDRLPEGASVNRTEAAQAEVSGFCAASTAWRAWSRSGVFSFLDGLVKSNAAFSLVTMAGLRTTGRPRDHTVRPPSQANGRARRSARRRSSPSTCRPSRASAPGRGSSSCCSTRRAAASELAATPAGSSSRRTAGSAPRGVYTTFSPTRRSSSSTSTATGSRARRQRSDVFAALKGTLGSVYVNDFNIFGRSWQVRMSRPCRARPRRGRGHRRIHVRAPRARWCRSRRLRQAHYEVGPCRSSATTTSAR